MIRDVVLVMGLTGWGKSLWTKLYSLNQPAKLIYDPSASFPDVIWDKIENHVEVLLSEECPKEFAFGFVNGDELQAAGGVTFAKGHMTLIVEECATVFEKGLARMPEWAKRICFFGRHRSCSIVLIAQRPTYIPIDFRSQANRVVTFCQHEGADMGWLGDFFDKDHMNRLSSLPKWYCFEYFNGVISEYSIEKTVEDRLGIKLDKSQHTDLYLDLSS